MGGGTETFADLECVFQAKGEVYKADKVVLCTGAYTPRLLEQSAKASGKQEVSAGERIVAGGITTGMTQLDEKSFERFKDMPVGVQGYTASTGTILTHIHTPSGIVNEGTDS